MPCNIISRKGYTTGQEEWSPEPVRCECGVLLANPDDFTIHARFCTVYQAERLKKSVSKRRPVLSKGRIPQGVTA